MEEPSKGPVGEVVGLAGGDGLDVDLGLGAHLVEEEPLALGALLPVAPQVLGLLHLSLDGEHHAAVDLEAARARVGRQTGQQSSAHKGAEGRANRSASISKKGAKAS